MISTQDMLSMVDENFFRLVPTKRKLMLFARQLLNSYCIENNIPPVDLQTCDLEMRGYARYSFKKSRILISKNFTRVYERLASEKNYYFLFQFFDTLLHELRHHYQYNSAKIHPIIKLVHDIEKETLARQFLPISYNMHPAEIDARYFAYSTLKKLSILTSYYKMAEYTSTEMHMLNNGTTGVVELVKQDLSKNTQEVVLKQTQIKEYLQKLAKQNGYCTDIENYEKFEYWKMDHFLLNEISPDFISIEFATNINDIETDSNIIKEIKRFYELYDEEIINGISKEF